MNMSVFTAACNLVERAKAHGHVGTMSAASSWEQLNSELGGVIPSLKINPKGFTTNG
ncbi:MAG: hypothetical protein ICV63_21410 [Coleofasciculus sp. Co-bin14]|nr:hypothetical protein [Coleofasciculus sp. Co-bin14]